ncbi:MAG: hypothetical protein QOJ68_873 [Blastococcus sp.]|jgi:hypothetical protein|nr:hypothetical protein [Blastococcus sp.]
MSERDEVPAERSASGYGTPGEGATTRPATREPRYGAADAGSADRAATAPEYSTRPVVIRRPDVLAALLLILAGIAAALSLVMRWLAHNDTTGMTLVRHGFAAPAHLISSGLWQPVSIVLGGGVLFVLGLLVFLPARSHRFFGVLALLVSLLVVTAVLVPFADAKWQANFFDVGFWFAAAVAACGLLGSLKAALTGPRYGTQAPEA